MLNGILDCFAAKQLHDACGHWGQQVRFVCTVVAATVN